jgi:ligand-binding sensor domain-containing protein
LEKNKKNPRTVISLYSTSKRSVVVETTIRNNYRTNNMTNIESIKIFIARNLILILLTLQISYCTGQVKEKSVNNKIESEANPQPILLNQSTTFPQIHTNLNGMVREFVRTMYQDKKGNYWFGTNGSGIIRYDGKSLEKMTIKTTQKDVSVREIVEDKAGNVWFATSTGLIKFDGEQFTTYSIGVGLQNEEMWSICIDRKGLIWVSTAKGVSHFDGEKFTPFRLPETKVENLQPMLSDQLVFQFLEDKNGTMWFATDGNGIFKYKNGEFSHLTSKNGLTDNNVSDLLEDKQGNIWIGTFYGGVSKYDGKIYTNFTKDDIIEGIEAYNFCEDRQGNIWFSAENIGVYQYNGATFTKFTTENGLTTNVVQSIFEDKKGQLWFGTWQGISIYDGNNFRNAKYKEPWTK